MLQRHITLEPLWLTRIAAISRNSSAELHHVAHVPFPVEPRGNVVNAILFGAVSDLVVSFVIFWLACCKLLFSLLWNINGAQSLDNYMIYIFHYQGTIQSLWFICVRTHCLSRSISLRSKIYFPRETWPKMAAAHRQFWRKTAGLKIHFKIQFLLTRMK